MRRLLLLVVVVAVIAVAAWVVGWSSLLAVQEVRVLGTRTVSPDQVRAAAGVSPAPHSRGCRRRTWRPGWTR